MQAHGASLLRVAGYDTSPEVGQRVLEFLLNFSKSHALPFVMSSYRHCPVGMSGVESLSAELLDQLDGNIDHVFVPVGGGGLFTAVCRGFFKEGPSIPRIHAVQTKGCSTISAAWSRGDDEIRSVTSTTTVTGISVSYNVDGDEALRMLRRVSGLGLTVSDEDVYAAQQRLLDREGIFAEPAGAASLAGLIVGLKAGQVDRLERIVCLVTGSGFKDPGSISRAAANRPAIWVGLDELERNLVQFGFPSAGT
jgi:threonine synthase